MTKEQNALVPKEATGRAKVAMNMLADFVPISVIAKYTDFAIDEVLSLSLTNPANDISSEYRERKTPTPFKHYEKFRKSLKEARCGDWREA